MKEDKTNKENVLVLFNCPSCKNRYDNSLRLPIILLCGVTLCSKCINEISRSNSSNNSSLEAQFANKSRISGNLIKNQSNLSNINNSNSQNTLLINKNQTNKNCPFHNDCNTSLEKSKTINR